MGKNNITKDDLIDAGLSAIGARRSKANKPQRGGGRSQQANATVVVQGEGSVDVSSSLEDENVPIGDKLEPTPDKGIISFGEESYMLNADDTVTTIRHRRIWSHGTRHVNFVVGHAPDAANVDGIPGAVGMNVLLGPADTGKSPVLEYIAKQTGGKMIRAGEPFAGYLRSTAELAGAMIGATESVICIDSFKNITGRLSGAAMIGGLSREFFAMLSDMSSYFAERGQVVYTVVNVSSRDDAMMQTVVQALESNTAGIWRFGEQGRINWLVRGNAGEQRRSGISRIEWNKKGVTRLISESGGVTPVNSIPARMELVAGHVDTITPLSRALNRVIRRTNHSDN